MSIKLERLSDRKKDQPEAHKYDDILKFRVIPSDEVPKPDAVLFFNGQMVMSRQDISCITGKAKVGKTFLMTLINEAVLHKGEFQGVLSSYLPKGKDKIIYIDTEQSKYHVSLVMKRIHDVISDNRIDNILMFNFRALDTITRRQYVEKLIYETEGVGLVIIDGISDLILDTNDLKDSVGIVDDLQRWTAERDLHISCVLHQNPSENSKMRGHLGTILTNKSETVIQISSAKDDESTKIVDTLATRNKKPESWSFEIQEGQPIISDIPYVAPIGGRKVKKVWQDYERYSVMMKVFADVKQDKGLGYSVLLERVRENTDAMGENALKEFVKYAKEMNWCCNDGKGTNYFLYPFTK